MSTAERAADPARGVRGDGQSPREQGSGGDRSPQKEEQGGSGGDRSPRGVTSWFRLLASELRLVFLRKRNMLLLAVTAVFPLVIGIALRLAAPHTQGGNGPGVAFFNQLAGNGVFLSFIALSTLLILVLPVVVAVVAGDSMAGEAGYGTLRYLLAVPAAGPGCSR